MGANDAREQLEAAKAECVRLERENERLRGAIGTLMPLAGDASLCFVGDHDGQIAMLRAENDRLRHRAEEFEAQTQRLAEKMTGRVRQLRTERDGLAAAIRKAREVVRGSSIPTGVSEATHRAILLNEAHAILSAAPADVLGTETCPLYGDRPWAEGVGKQDRRAVLEEAINHIRRHGFGNLTKDEAIQMLQALAQKGATR